MVEHLAYPIFRPICSERVCLSSRLAEKQPNVLSERLSGLFLQLGLLFALVGATQEFPNTSQLLSPIQMYWQRVVMGGGWLRNPEDGWTYRFDRDEKAWAKDPRVFVDMGRPMLDGSPALLKTRQHLRREQAEGMWKDLVRKGWEKVPAVWGVDAEL